MKFLSAKKLILIGFIVILLIAIPIAIYLVQQQQQTRSQAAAATTLSFEPVSSPAAPIEGTIGAPVVLDIFVDPGEGQNLVSFVSLDISYDPTVLAPVEETETTAPFSPNQSALSLLDGPVFTEGHISATMSVGVDPTRAIQTKTQIATVTFIPIASTDVPTTVDFTTTSQVLSEGTGEEGSENVLIGREPAYVQILGTEGEPTATPSATLSPSPTITGVSASITPTVSPSASPTATLTQNSSTNEAPICESLSSVSDTTGTAPFSLTMTALGTDPDGTIALATFSFGDGQVQNVTTGGGIGTSSLNLPITHTYTNSGNYTASVVLTDNNNNVSATNCTLDITVLEANGQVAQTETQSQDTAQLAETGPGDVLVGAGVAVGIITIIGAALFFLL